MALEVEIIIKDQIVDKVVWLCNFSKCLLPELVRDEIDQNVWVPIDIFRDVYIIIKDTIKSL